MSTLLPATTGYQGHHDVDFVYWVCLQQGSGSASIVAGRKRAVLIYLPSVFPAGRLDAEVLSVTRRVGELLQKLPRDINPVNLEELRRIKQALVELENKVRR